MSHPINRRDFLVAAAASGTAYLAAPLSPAFGQQSTSPDSNFHVYLAFGQSNMEGYPGIEPQDKSGVNKRFQMLAAVEFATLGRKKGEWYDAIPPLCRTSTGLCPVDYFGRTMVSRMPERITIGVVNVAVAGCKIELFDKGYLSGLRLYRSRVDDQHHQEYGGNPYQHFVDMAKLAQKRGVIKGICCTRASPTRTTRTWPNKVAKSTEISSET
jgi:hypothetical protein